MQILSQDFYCRRGAVVAKELLGKYLVGVHDGHRTSRMITEVEVYDGPHDLASHAARGKTPRTEAMFRAGGVWYVYLVYGLHWLLNIVTGPADYPSAVLIRGVEGIVGPAKVAKFFGVDKRFYAQPATLKTQLCIADRQVKIKATNIIKTARIGVAYAGPIWSQKKYRFFIKN